MDKKALFQLILGLCASNSVMMTAWYILLPIPMPILVAIFPSWGMACLEYLFHVTANRATYDKLGLMRLRGTNEVINIFAFLGILAITQQPFYWKYGIEVVLVVMVAGLFLIKHNVSKVWLIITGILALGWCVFTTIWLKIPSTDKLSNIQTLFSGLPHIFQVALPGGLPAIFFAGALIANSFMILAWYSHVFIDNPPRWFNLSSFRRLLYAYLISIAIAFLEYCVLIPVSRMSYKFVSMMALYGYMEISTVTVFLIFAFFRTRQHHREEFRLNKVHVIGLVLLALIESSTGIF